MDPWCENASSIPRNTLTLVFPEKYWNAYLRSERVSDFQKKKIPLKKASELQLVNPEVCKEVTADCKGTSCAPTPHRAPPFPHRPPSSLCQSTGAAGRPPELAWLTGTGDRTSTLRGVSLNAVPWWGSHSPGLKPVVIVLWQRVLYWPAEPCRGSCWVQSTILPLARKGTWLLQVSSTYWALLNLAHLLRCSLLPLCHCSWEFVSLSKLTFLFQVGLEGANLHVWF